MNPVKFQKMKNQIPTDVSEVKLTYKSRVKAEDRPQIKCSHDAYRILFSNWDEDLIELCEEFYILLLDRANRVMGRFRVSQGSMSGTLVDARMVFACAIKGRAHSLILAHNHPSCQLKPSQADKTLTTKLVAAGKLLDLPILDHLILSPEGGYFSFADEGILEGY
jgi:DNA repair protein RadC